MADPIDDDDGAGDGPDAGNVPEKVTRNGGRRTVAEQAADGGEQGEMFPEGILAGDKKTLRSLIKPGQAVETTVALSRAEVPLRDGLPDPDKPVRVLVTARFHKCEPIAKREGDAEKVSSWKLRVHLKSAHCESVAATDDELIRQRFAVLLEQSPTAAGELLDQLRAAASEALVTA